MTPHGAWRVSLCAIYLHVGQRPGQPSNHNMELSNVYNAPTTTAPTTRQPTTHPTNKHWRSATVGFIYVNLVNVGVTVHIIISYVVVVTGWAADVVDGSFINCLWICPPGHRVPAVSPLDEFIYFGE